MPVEPAERGRLLALAAILVAFACAAPAANAQEVWVKDEVNLNLRTGPGNQYRIVGLIKTGDSVRIVKRGDGWTQVRISDGKSGWVPAGFLMPDPPAATRVERMEHETRELRETVADLRSKLGSISSERGELEQSESEARARMVELETENMELKAGARWPEWITGACILAGGMLVGSILQTWASRRPRSRIRL